MFSKYFSWLQFEIPERRTGIILFCIIFLGLTLRVVHWYLEPSISRDGSYYLFIARQWYECGSLNEIISATAVNGAHFYISPLLLALLRSATICHLDPEKTICILNIGLSTALVVLGYALCRVLNMVKEAALVAALLLATHPGLIDLSHTVQRETLFLFFATLMIFLLLQSEIRQNRPLLSWGCAGACWMLAFFSRHEALELVFMILFIVGWYAITRRSLRRSLLKKGLVFVASGALMLIALNWWCQIPVEYYQSALSFRLHQAGIVETKP